MPPHPQPHVSPALELVARNGLSRLFGLDRDIVRVGRDSGSEVVLEDLRVSRAHARILRRADGFYIEDLKSHNLPYLDGQALPPKPPVPLRDGSRIEICDHRLFFRRTAVVIRPEEPGDSAVLKTLDDAVTIAPVTRPDRTGTVLQA